LSSLEFPKMGRNFVSSVAIDNSFAARRTLMAEKDPGPGAFSNGG
jgi:hypothetical protein